MFLPGLAHILLWIIVAISIVLMLVRPRGIAEVWAAKHERSIAAPNKVAGGQRVLYS